MIYDCVVLEFVERLKLLLLLCSLHAPDGNEEASDLVIEGKPDLSELSNSVTDTVSLSPCRLPILLNFNCCIVLMEEI